MMARIGLATLFILTPLSASAAEITFVLEYGGPHQVSVGEEATINVLATFDAPLVATRFSLVAEGEGEASLQQRTADPIEPNGLSYLSPTLQSPYETDLPHAFADGPKTEVLYDADFDEQPGGPEDGLQPGSDILIEGLTLRADASGVVRVAIVNPDAAQTQSDPDGVNFDLIQTDEAAAYIIFAVGDSDRPFDYDADGDIDAVDYRSLYECLTGPTPASLPPGCGFFDADADSDVDLLDLGAFASAFDPD